MSLNQEAQISGVDWSSFLSHHDLLWNNVPRYWLEGAFVGSGLLGAMIYSSNAHTVTIDVGRTDIVETRGQRATVTANTLHDISRLNVGNLLLKFRGVIEGGETKIDLWNAEARGTIRTSQGSVSWRCFAASVPSVIVVETTVSGNEAITWQWKPGWAVPPRKIYRKEAILPHEWNPSPSIEARDGATVCTQSLTAGGAYSTVYQLQSIGDKSTNCYLSIGWSKTAEAVNDSVQEAMSHVSTAVSAGLETINKNHRKWWHDFYPQSFISIPDRRMESFYWIQIYKMGSAMRKDTPPADLMGPWFKITSWPAIWWNMNIQMAYMPQLASNRMELGEPFLRMLDDNIQYLIQNVDPKYQPDSAGIGRASSFDCRSKQGPELHSLPWACHVYWLYYQYSMDDEVLKRLYPLLKRSITLLLHHLEIGSDNLLHMRPSSVSEGESLRDSSLTMGPLKWGLKTLIQSASHLKIDESQVSKWKETLDRLAPYALDERGLMLGEGVPSKMQPGKWKSRCSYAFMLPIYPFYDLNVDNPRERQIIEQTVHEWLGCSDDWELFHSYGYTMAASMFSMLDQKDEIPKWLNKFLDTRVQPNTMYEEGEWIEDRGLPCLEGAFTFCVALHDLLLQSWNGILRIFPGIPSTWKDVTFHHLRGEGAFLVSASRREGTTDWVQIKSLKGSSCRVKVDLKHPIQFAGQRKFDIQNKDGILTIDLKCGESILLQAEGNSSDKSVSCVENQFGPINYWGARKN